MKELRQNNRLFAVEINLICLTILFYLNRVAVPFFKYPFIALFTLLLINSLIKSRNQIVAQLITFIKDFYLILILALILILSCLASNKLYLIVFKDIFNAGILLSLFFIAGLYVKTKENLAYFVSSLINQLIIFAFFICVVQFWRIFDISLSGYPVIEDENIPSLAMDNNFLILQVILGMVCLVYRMVLSKSNKWIFSFLLLLFSVSVLFSSSRRGLIMLIIFVLSIFVVKILKSVFKWPVLKKIQTDFSIFLLLLLSFLIISWSFVRYVPYNNKNDALTFIGVKNLLHTKVKISGIAFSYISVFNKAVTITDVYNKIWTPAFNPNDPESSWGTRIHKTVYPLTGKSVEIVPEGAKGYLMDSTCNSSYYNSNDVCESYSLVNTFRTKNLDHIDASVFCFVSEDFNGNSVSFSVGDASSKKGLVMGNILAYYDLNSKGVWQKLILDFDCKEGEIPLYLSFHKTGIKSFRELKGYVIFAYPYYVQSGEGVTTEKTLTDQNILPGKNEISSSVGSVLYPIILPLINQVAAVNQEQDPIRKWTSKFISEDTTYYGFKKNLLTGPESNAFSDSRIVRWQFGWQIFSKEFNIRQKIFGGGFSFLNWYGYYFLGDKTASDWPHNPFLSILLYSGIIGLSIFIFFFCIAFYYYSKYIRVYPSLFICFLITLFFSFFSGSSPFDPPVMGFFIILPYFIQSVHKRDKESIDLNSTE